MRGMRRKIDLKRIVWEGKEEEKRTEEKGMIGEKIGNRTEDGMRKKERKGGKKMKGTEE